MKWFGRRQIESDGNDYQSPAERPMGTYFPVALVVLTLVALLIRLYAAADNFGLDEIFTYYLAMYQVHAVSDIFTGIKIEHHFLVTLSMYLLGDQLNWVWYRLPSVIAGTGTLALMALVGYRRMRPVALIVMLAVATVSYPMVLQSSEARGYAPAAFFSLVMWVLIEAYWRYRNKVWLIGFWSATVIAVLYHPVAVCIYLSLGLWSIVREWRVGGGLLRVGRELVLCHAVPIAFMALLYVAVMRHWGSVGGDILPLARVISDTMAVALGFPMRPEFRWVALFFGCTLIASGLVIIARLVRSDIWIFYLSALLLAPALMLGIINRPYFYVRYFVVLFPFFFLMLGEAMDAVAKKFKEAQAVVVGLCFLTLVGNILLTVDFLRVGRAGYLDAVQYMATLTPRPTVTVGSDSDFRNGYTIIFYRRYLPKNKSMVYLTLDEWPSEGPDWFLIDNAYSEDFIPESIGKVRDKTFRLVKSYPVLGLSGVGWHLYRNDARF